MKAFGNKTLCAFIILAGVILSFSARSFADDEAGQEVTCSDLVLPSAPALAGRFVGVSGNALILAGGVATDGAPTDVVYVLPQKQSGETQRWLSFQLHEKLAWGASVTADDSLICLGGEGPAGCEKTIIRLR